jgi:hypothetical protein
MILMIGVVFTSWALSVFWNSGSTVEPAMFRRDSLVMCGLRDAVR